MKLLFENTYPYQAELLPRLTVFNFESKGISFEWLFWSITLMKDND